MAQQSDPLTLALACAFKRGLGASAGSRSPLSVCSLSLGGGPPTGPIFSGGGDEPLADSEFKSTLARVASCGLVASGGADGYFETSGAASNWIFTYFGSVAAYSFRSNTSAVGLARPYASAFLLKGERDGSNRLHLGSAAAGGVSRIFFQIASLFLVTKYFSGPPYYLICSTSIIF